MNDKLQDVTFMPGDFVYKKIAIKEIANAYNVTNYIKGMNLFEVRMSGINMEGKEVLKIGNDKTNDSDCRSEDVIHADQLQKEVTRFLCKRLQDVQELVLPTVK